MSKVSALTGIPETTLAHWKNKADWWDEMVAEVRSQIGEAILAQNLQIATKAAERVLDSLENGDEKLIWDKDKREHRRDFCHFPGQSTDTDELAHINHDEDNRHTGPCQTVRRVVQAMVREAMPRCRGARRR
jgi:hypothetical protein